MSSSDECTLVWTSGCVLGHIHTDTGGLERNKRGGASEGGCGSEEEWRRDVKSGQDDTVSKRSKICAWARRQQSLARRRLLLLLLVYV